MVGTAEASTDTRQRETRPMNRKDRQNNRCPIWLDARNGVESRFRATTNHMVSGLPENGARPLPRNATQIHLPVL